MTWTKRALVGALLFVAATEILKILYMAGVLK